MWYDGLLGDVHQRLGQVVESISTPVASPGDGQSVAVFKGNLQAELEHLQTSLEQLRLRSSGRLPAVWGLLFFASLAVLLATTVFQLACPEIVRRFGLEEFTRERKREYAEAPSASAVARAIEYLEARSIAAGLIEEEQDAERRTEFELADMRRRLEEAEYSVGNLQDERRAAADKPAWDDLNSSLLRSGENSIREFRDEVRRFTERDRGDRGPDFRRKMALIETAATSYYLDEARRSVAAMTVCAVGYLVALLMLTNVFFTQARAVATAIGWRA